MELHNIGVKTIPFGHSDLILSGHKHTVFASLSESLAQHCIVCTSPSKTFNLAGLKPAMAIIPNAMIRRDFRHTLHACGIGNPNIFCLDAVKAAYEYGEPWLKDLLDYLEGNVTFMRRFLAEEIPQIRMIRPEGTYLIWLDCRSLGLGPKLMEQWLLTKARLVLNQGYTFGPGGEAFVRMNIACPRAMLEDGLKRLAQAVRDL